MLGMLSCKGGNNVVIFVPWRCVSFDMPELEGSARGFSRSLASRANGMHSLSMVAMG